MSRWGFGSAVHGTANATTTSSQILAANANRVWARLTNVGTAIVSFRLGTAVAVSLEGIRLGTEGADRTWDMSRGQQNVWTGAIQGIAAGGTSKVVAVEGEALNPT